MADTPDADQERIRHEALRQELEAARRRRDSYQALIKDLPEIFEGKFRERLRPLQQRNEQLQLEGMALREQIRRVLPQAGGATPAAPGLEGPSQRVGSSAHPDGVATAAGGEGSASDSQTIAAPTGGLAGSAPPASSAAAFNQPPAFNQPAASAATEPITPAEPQAPVPPPQQPWIDGAPEEQSWGISPLAGTPPTSPGPAAAAGLQAPSPPPPTSPITGGDASTNWLPEPEPRTRPRRDRRSVGQDWTSRWLDALRTNGPANRQPLLLAAAAALGVAVLLPLANQGLRESATAPDRKPSAIKAAANSPAPIPATAPVAATGSTPVQLSSVAPSWLEVENGDGETLYYDILHGSRSFPSDRGLRLRAGRPDLIRIRIQGQPERPLGTVYEVDWHTLQAPEPAP